MLYKRSSFIKWLHEVKNCEITPFGSGKGAGYLVRNGSCKCYIGGDTRDLIDYEEIFLHYNSLYLDGLPGNSELEIVE